MSFESDLMVGLAQHLATAGAGIYRASGSYAANEIGIVFDVVPQSPDAVVSLSLYPLTDDPTQTDSVHGLQVRCRAAGGDPRSVRALASAVFDALQGFGPADVGGVRVQGITRTSGLPLGKDQSSRWERSENYQITIHHPGSYRL